MATQQERRALTRQKIIDAAAELFLQNGFENTTIMQILEKADIVKGTFYQHFETKMDLLVVLGREDGAKRVRKLIAEVQQGLSPLEALQRYYRVLAQWFEAHPAIAEDAIVSALRLHDPESDSPESVAHDFTRLMLKIAKKKGEVRADIDVTSQAILIGGAFTLAAIDWSRKPVAKGLQKRFNACYRAFAQGVQTVPASNALAKTK
jgi:AcrR family transcriptional regulator